MTTVAVVGLGGMGSRMARRLLSAGHELVVWNRSPEKMEDLVALGATPAETPADAARRAEVVLTMVSDPEALQAVTEGPDGIAGGAEGSVTFIEMSTVGPAAIKRLASTLSPETPLLDAPVLGSPSEAEAGSLKIFMGGAEDLVQRWMPLLSELGSPMHVGPLGAGAAAKLVANTTLVGALGVLGEALALGEALGLSRDTTFEVLAATPLSAQAERRRDPIEKDDFPLRFALALAQKDAELITEAAAGSEADLRLTEAARSWFADANKDGWGERDYSAILAYILSR